jgi:hypothetical protein
MNVIKYLVKKLVLQFNVSIWLLIWELKYNNMSEMFYNYFWQQQTIITLVVRIRLMTQKHVAVAALWLHVGHVFYCYAGHVGKTKALWWWWKFFVVTLTIDWYSRMTNHFFKTPGKVYNLQIYNFDSFISIYCTDLH